MPSDSDKEIPEYYSDTFEIVGGPYGVTFNFKQGPPEPRMEARGTIARIRMSWEHAKTMTFVTSRYIKRIEQESGVSYPIPNKVLSDLGVAREDWDAFWKSPGL
jgi:hypothetical protein